MYLMCRRSAGTTTVSTTLLLVGHWKTVSKRAIFHVYGGLTFNISFLDIITELLRTSSVNLAANTKASTQNLQHGTLQFTREGFVRTTHGSCNVKDFIERDGLRVLDVLLLFAVTGRFLQGADDERRCGGDDADSSLSILDGKLDCDAETFLWSH